MDQAILAQLKIIAALLHDLITTARFNRGGYDGPFLSQRSITVPNSRAVEIYPGRGAPTALLIDVTGTGGVGELLFVSDDAGSVRAGWRVRVTGDAQFRFIADANQRYYAQAESAVDLPIRVVEGRL